MNLDPSQQFWILNILLLFIVLMIGIVLYSSALKMNNINSSIKNIKLQKEKKNPEVAAFIEVERTWQSFNVKVGGANLSQCNIHLKDAISQLEHNNIICSNLNHEYEGSEYRG